MTLKLANNAIGKLGSSLTESGTSLTMQSGDGDSFPSLSGSEYHCITVVRAASPTLFEIMRVTARSGDTLTVDRGQEGTTQLTFSSGDIVELRMTAGNLDESLPQQSNSEKGQKRLQFNVTNITLGQMRTITIPDRDMTLASGAESPVQSDSLDTTSGALMAVGAGGLLTGSVDLTDSEYDNLIINGFFNADQSATGVSGIGSANQNFIQWGSGNRRSQLIAPGSSDDGLSLSLKQFDSSGSPVGISSVALTGVGNRFTEDQEFDAVVRFTDDGTLQYTNHATGSYFYETLEGVSTKYIRDSSGTNQFQFLDNGAFRANENIIAYSNSLGSDIRYKSSIRKLSPAECVDAICDLQGRYYWHDKLRCWDSGFIAQEVQKIDGLGHLLSWHEDLAGQVQRLHLNYQGIIPYLSEAFKSEKKRADALEARVDDLERKLDQLLENS